jgi:hypothetical protein
MYVLSFFSHRMRAQARSVMTPNQGTPSEVSSTESLERAHTRNFLDAVVLGAKINAPLEAGIRASLPIQMALKSYWLHKTVSQSQLA